QRKMLKLHHHDGDTLLSAEMCVLRWHGNTLHQVLHLVLETALVPGLVGIKPMLLISDLIDVIDNVLRIFLVGVEAVTQ
ncbi:hypothetical protein, partial [Pseudomonas fluorescens]|uniref:hypothetical protein n=1 Tax=Pseudomonas fluorescens TaxID=294 RepID=UPI001CD6C2C4